MFIHAGWGRRWRDPDDGRYYRDGPGLALDAAMWMAERGVRVVGLDNPFTDPVASEQLEQGTELPLGVSPHATFAIHDFNLVRAGVLQIQSPFLSDLAADGVTQAAFF